MGSGGVVGGSSIKLFCTLVKNFEITHDPITSSAFIVHFDMLRLMAHIRHKATQQGWTWTMRDEFMEYIKKRGSDNVNVSHMIADLAPLGRGAK